jgi:hypothetical protein
MSVVQRRADGRAASASNDKTLKVRSPRPKTWTPDCRLPLSAPRVKPFHKRLPYLFQMGGSSNPGLRQ